MTISNTANRSAESVCRTAGGSGSGGDLSGLDRVGRIAYVLTHLELTRPLKNVIYVVDEAHRFLSRKRTRS